MSPQTTNKGQLCISWSKTGLQKPCQVQVSARVLCCNFHSFRSKSRTSLGTYVTYGHVWSYMVILGLELTLSLSLDSVTVRTLDTFLPDCAQRGAAGAGLGPVPPCGWLECHSGAGRPSSARQAGTAFACAGGVAGACTHRDRCTLDCITSLIMGAPPGLLGHPRNRYRHKVWNIPIAAISSLF